MKPSVLTSIAALGVVLTLSQASASLSSVDRLIAIDVLLEPDRTMVARAEAVNARLRANYAPGYQLDATHAPHVTLLQRFVRARDFDAVTAAVTKVVAAERPADLRLRAKGLDYFMWAGLAIADLSVERTPELMRLHRKLIDALAPFAVSGGAESAFVGASASAETISWVETFVPGSSGEHYFPHVTAGIAKEDFVKPLQAEPFEAFTFKPEDLAIYQLGNFGAAAKKLWQGPSVEPLPSWNEGAAKQSILDFVRRVTTEGSPDFVPAPERIATFDNDGTLWVEQPFYAQGMFVFDRIRTLAPQHPDWKSVQPFKAVLENDMATVDKGGMEALNQLLMATHAGMTTDEFDRLVKYWLATARHPRFHKPYPDLVYQPMLELLAYLRANEFKTFIVTGGGVEFVRAFSEMSYGIPPEQVVGSSIVTKYEVQNGKPVLEREAKIDFIDDGDGKPEGINRFLGRRPIAAFGNSDGDVEMLRWVTAAKGARFGLLVHHDDAEREYAYDRTSAVGKLDRGLDEARARGWTVVGMKDDWKSVFPFEGK